jgi:hypothetical protein
MVEDHIGIPGVVYQASSFVFLYLSQCNHLPSKVYKNFTTNSHKAVHAVCAKYMSHSEREGAPVIY